MALKKIYDIIPPSVENTITREKEELKEKTEKEKEPELLTKEEIKEGSYLTPLKQGDFKVGKKKNYLFKKIIIIFSFFALLGIIGFLLFDEVEVKIWLKTEPFSIKKEITIDPNVKESDLKNGIFKGQVFEAEKEKTKEFPATGKFLKKQKARGVLTIYNEYSTSSRILIPSRFISADGKLFWSTKTITIPGLKYEKSKIIPGKVDVEVEAAEAGKEYNIGPSSFALPALAGSPLYTAIYAKSFSPMTGGFIGEVSQVTKDDLNKAEAILTQELRNETEDSLVNSVSKDFILIKDTISQEIVKNINSKEAGSEADSFDKELGIKLQVVGFKKADLDEFVKSTLDLNIEKEKNLQEKSLETIYNLKSFDEKSKKVVLTVEINCKTYFKINDKELKKNLLGKSMNELKIFLSNLEGVEKIEIKSWPFLRKRVPDNVNKLNIEFRVD